MASGLIFLALFWLLATLCQSQPSDVAVMKELKKSLMSAKQLGWVDTDPCNWNKVQCSKDKRVVRIQIGRQNLQGSLPPSLRNLTSLQVFEAQANQLTGPLPSFAGLNSLQSLLLSYNNFTSVPSDFFDGLTSLQDVSLDYNSFSFWPFPDSLKDASGLKMFSATSANINGPLPDFFDKFSSLSELRLGFNFLEGTLPKSFAGSSIQSLRLNGQKSSSRLNGSIAVLQNMTQLTEVWLHDNSFYGPLPEFGNLNQLQNVSLRDNSLTGRVPDSLIGLKSLRVVNLTNNLLQGKTPEFGSSVQLDMRENSNSFCLPDPKLDCDTRVNDLLDVLSGFDYPITFAENWKGNDPCVSWKGITCSKGEITVVNLKGMGLIGTISPKISVILSLQRVILSDNNITGTIPLELTGLPNLREFDVSNNQIYGEVPTFGNNVRVNIDGNVNIGKKGSPPTAPGGKGNSSAPSSQGSGSVNGSGNSGAKKSSSHVVEWVIGLGCGFILIGLFIYFFYRKKYKGRGNVQSMNKTVTHPEFSSFEDNVEITFASSDVNGGMNESHINGSSGSSDMHIVEAGSMVISIQVLKNVTNNFSELNILGKGGFGTVYKGELQDETKIAVKRMESGVMGEKGLEEFKAEIAVLTKVRHRHLVALLGYCLDGNERLLVYEYMPQGTLTRYLLDWKEEGLKPLTWMQRLTIALDVARGVEYLHGLAQQIFIHRDLKPSNILLGDDMRAKVADFGLVRLAPDGKHSVAATRLAGTFGYLAPEYAVTGRVSTKVDVFSFGVILMELITGRRALDDSLPGESHLVPWFRNMLIKKDVFTSAIDPTLDVNEETIASINTVAELAGYCSAREPSQRPHMNHVVNVLSSLAESWKPIEPDNPDDMYEIDYDMSLPQAMQKWQAHQGTTEFDSSYVSSTQTSIHARTSGFADSFTSGDAR